ncbi:MAG: ferritin-like domain-containing protein [Acidobacteriaceae bacterium]
MALRTRIRRHLSALLSSTLVTDSASIGIAKARGTGLSIPGELNGRQDAILLLQVAASIEHALMVEYLFAGYSLGGSQVPECHRMTVARWRETILGIAKEEMGHLMTIQNVLRCIGGPISLDRDDYPWDSEFYPFPFELEPLTLQSLAKYVYTESPGSDVFTGPEADEIFALAVKGSGNGTVHRVGVLYAKLEELFSDLDLVPDAAFREDTFPFQANWDEWGRGYQRGARGNSTGGMMPRTPDLLILPVTARTDVLSALDQIATQGEAATSASDTEPSHFARFLRIFREFPQDASWAPSRNVAINPVVEDQSGSGTYDNGDSVITDPEAIGWAHLFNVRYRLLLVNLLHTFEYPSNLSERSELTPRGLLIHSTFGEMYNLRALSDILMDIPIAHGAAAFAGPPFQMPYTMKLPVDGIDRWNLHLDLLESSRMLISYLQSIAGQRHAVYLRGIADIDAQMSASIHTITAGIQRQSSIMVSR